MLAPDGPEPVWQQVMQQVSAVLIDRPELVQALHAGDRARAAALLETELGCRLQSGLTGR